MKIEITYPDNKKIIRVYLEANNILASMMGKKIIVLQNAPDLNSLTGIIGVILKSDQSLKNISFGEYQDIIRLKHFLEQEGYLVDAPDEQLQPKMEV